VPQQLPVELRPMTAKDSAYELPAIHGVLTDMGAAGMHVLLGRSYSPGTKFRVEVVLDGRLVLLAAEVRHTRWVSATIGMTYGHGLQIMEIEEETLYYILAYLDQQVKMMSSIYGRKAA
jgi:hypothetical protein